MHETLEVVLRGLVEIWSQWPRAPEVTESKYWEAVADSATKDLTDTEVLFTLLGSQWDPKLKEGRLSALITSCGASCQSVSRQRSRRCSNGR